MLQNSLYLSFCFVFVAKVITCSEYEALQQFNENVQLRLVVLKKVNTQKKNHRRSLVERALRKIIFFRSYEKTF